MKIIPSVLLAMLVMGNHICSAQEDTSGKTLKPIAFNVPTPKSPLYVLKAGETSMEFNPMINEELNVDALDRKSIKTITVLSDKDARAQYGQGGSNGVIIFTLDDSYILSKEALMKPKWGK